MRFLWDCASSRCWIFIRYRCASHRLCFGACGVTRVNGASPDGDRAAGLRPQPPAASSLSSIPGAVAQEACDLLAERIFGNPARSPGHNARVILETAIRKAEGHWRCLSSDTAWIDGRDLVLFAYDMEVSARFCPGEWWYGHEGSEYNGAVWSCFDDQFQIEIEEISDDPSIWHHGRATHWREPSPPPASVDERSQSQGREDGLSPEGVAAREVNHV